MATRAPWHRREDIEACPFDSSGLDERLLVRLPRGRHLQLSRPVYELLLLLDGERSSEDVSAALSEKLGRGFTPEQINHLVEKFLLPHGLLAVEDENSAATSQKNEPFWLKLPLIQPRVLRPITGLTQYLFTRPALGVTGLLSGLALARFLLLDAAGDLAAARGVLSGYDYALIYLLIIASMLWHELGHASACRRYGCAPGAIGVAMYLTFPVFYSRVTEVWSLPRRQRAVVDAGGMYFQLILIDLLALSTLVVPDPPWRVIGTVVIVTVLSMIVVGLNPFLKYDGYWLLADLTGIANLRHRENEFRKHLLQSAWAGLRRRPGPAMPPELANVPTSRRVLLALYTVISTAFFLYFGYLLLLAAGILVLSLPQQVYPLLLAAWSDLTSGLWDHALNDLLRIVMPVIMAIPILFFVIRLPLQIPGVSHFLRKIRGILVGRWWPRKASPQSASQGESA